MKLKDRYYKTKIANIKKTIIVLILYVFLNNLIKIDFLSIILRINIIILKFNLSRFFIFYSIGL